MSVRVNKCIKDTDESVKLSSQLINVVLEIPDVSDFINDRPENTPFQTIEDEILYFLSQDSPSKT